MKLKLFLLLMLACFFIVPECAAKPCGKKKTKVSKRYTPLQSVADKTPKSCVNKTFNDVAAPLKSDLPPLIVIDPGHGGEDFGTKSLIAPKYLEKNFNLSTAYMLRNYLNQMGYRTVMTRTTDVFISLERRAAFANARKPQLFVSVHYNSAPSKEAQGVEVFFYRSEDNQTRTARSQRLAKEIIDNIIANTGAKSRGVKHGNLSVIRNTEMPAVLVEGGFLSNDAELQKLKDAGYLKQIAWGIAQGIHNYLSN